MFTVKANFVYRSGLTGKQLKRIFEVKTTAEMDKVVGAMTGALMNEIGAIQIDASKNIVYDLSKITGKISSKKFSETAKSLINKRHQQLWRILFNTGWFRTLPKLKKSGLKKRKYRMKKEGWPGSVHSPRGYFTGQLKKNVVENYVVKEFNFFDKVKFKQKKLVFTEPSLIVDWSKENKESFDYVPASVYFYKSTLRTPRFFNLLVAQIRKFTVLFSRYGTPYAKLDKKNPEWRYIFRPFIKEDIPVLIKSLWQIEAEKEQVEEDIKIISKDYSPDISQIVKNVANQFGFKVSGLMSQTELEKLLTEKATELFKKGKKEGILFTELVKYIEKIVKDLTG